MTIDKENISTIEAQINKLNLICPYGVLGIYWEAENIGFSRLELFFDKNGQAHIRSESMDSNIDERFIKAILMRVINEAIVDE